MIKRFASALTMFIFPSWIGNNKYLNSNLLYWIIIKNSTAVLTFCHQWYLTRLGELGLKTILLNKRLKLFWPSIINRYYNENFLIFWSALDAIIFEDSCVQRAAPHNAWLAPSPFFLLFSSPLSLLILPLVQSHYWHFCQSTAENAV